MPVTVAFLDASVLYPAPLRDLLLELAVSDFYRARWSDAVHDEWIRALQRRRPDIPATRLERTRRLMDAHVRDALVSGFEKLIPAIRLPDPDDRHVVAAATRGEADIIVTANLKDFPASVLAAHGIEAQHPDGFLVRLYRESPDRFVEALERVRTRLRNPPISHEQHLDALRRAGLNAALTEIVAASSSTRPASR